VIPAGECLHPDDFACCEGHLWLKVDFEFVALDCVNQLSSDACALPGKIVEVRRMEADAVASFRLRPIQGQVGLLEDGFRGFGIREIW
jgi:hypothetical protein